MAAEKLAEEGWKLDHETLRRWLIEGGQWQRRRRRGPHRQRRPRRSHFGELVQLDGSHHRWWGEQQRCLINLVDDATNRRLGVMAEEETSEAAMRALWAWIRHYGIPQAVYVDRKNVYVTRREATLEEQLAGELPLTAFGQACRKLGIEMISSYSPQARGRVERAHGVDQDRLVKEFQLEGIRSVEAANRFLQKCYWKQINRKFARPPAAAPDYHRRVPSPLRLEEVFCWEENRTVQNDWTLRYQNRWLQIEPHQQPQPRPKQKVLVRQLLNGKIQLLYRQQRLRFRWLKQAPQPVGRTPAAALGRPVSKLQPAPDHPWRRPCLRSRQVALADTFRGPAVETDAS